MKRRYRYNYETNQWDKLISVDEHLQELQALGLIPKLELSDNLGKLSYKLKPDGFDLAQPNYIMNNT